MLRAAELAGIGSLATYQYGVDAYDQTKLGLGKLMVQNTGAGATDKWLGPLPIALIRPMEYSTTIPGIFPWAMQWSSTEDWVFLVDNAAAAATRRLMIATFNRSTGAFNVVGFITITFPTATNFTIRGLRMTYDTYSTGTVSASGTAVTGSGTAWQTNRMCVGNRIGFGSTDPTQISTWYEIGAIGSDTSITLTTSAGTVTGGTAFVIEDLRAVIAATNATATNGGLFVVKGLRKELFSSGGGSVPAATTVDNIKACYWLKDAATVTNTTANGLGLQVAGKSLTSQMCWVGNGTTTQQLFKHDIRAALTLTSGAATNQFQFSTAVSATLTGTATQANNGRCATLSHGPGSGSECYYFTTTTRIYRTKALSSITTGDTTFITSGDVMTEVPPGSTTTFAATGSMQSIEYAASIDKLIVSTGANTNRLYFTAYNTAGNQIDRIFGVDSRQLQQTTTNANVTPHINTAGNIFSVWAEAGMVYLATIGTTATTNIVYAAPLGADWEYASASGSFVLTPRIATTDADRYRRVFIEHADMIGGASGMNLGLPVEPLRVYYRTAGISDDSGSWTLLDDTHDMAGTVGAGYVQFKIEFRTLGQTCIPGRVHAIGILYDDLSTLANYQLSVTKSDAANKRFAWRFAVAFGASVPALRVRLYDAVTGNLLVDDNTASPGGTFERATDGASWGAWNGTDKGNETTYLRYTPATLADGVNVRPVLTLNA